MISAVFQPTIFTPSPVVFTEDPSVKLELYSKDPQNSYLRSCSTWTKSDSDIYVRHENGGDIIGLHGGRSLTSATLTETITFNETGRYWVLIRAYRNPENGNKTIGLGIDGDLKGAISCYSPWHHYRYLDYGYIDIAAGDRDFTIYLNGKDAWVDHILLYKLDYFSSEERGKYNLAWDNIEFTENAMGELNSGTATMALMEEWNDPNRNPFSRKMFDYWDVFNIIVGPQGEKGKVKFGGYLIGWDESDDSSQITFNAVDRFADLYNRPSYTNYYIGVAPSGEATTFPALQFGSALEAIRHANETAEYGLLSYGISYPYTLNKDFRVFADYESVTVSGFTKTFNPSTGLRLGYDKLIVNHCGVAADLDCSGILFYDPGKPIDAAIDEILAIKYLGAGESCGLNTRVQVNFEVTMYKDGQNPSDAMTYTILFTGKAGASNIIGQIQPVLNGIEQIAKFDWKTAFDNYGGSAHYYVTKIEVVDTATQAQMEKRQNSTLNLIGLTSYNGDINTKIKLTQETSYPYDNIKEILDKIEYVAWTDYGLRRALDVFCIAPEMNEASPIIAEEGVNVLKITDKSYAPNDSLKNRIMSHYHYNEGDTDKTGVSYVENIDSIRRYGPGAKEVYEDQTEINNLTDANLENTRYIKKNCYPMSSFTMVLRGTSLLNPSQYIVSKLYGDYLVGEYSTKTVTHTINKDEGYTTRVSVNKPGSYYKKIMRKLEDKIAKYKNIQSRAAYNQNIMSQMGFSNTAAFIRSGY